MHSADWSIYFWTFGGQTVWYVHLYIWYFYLAPLPGGRPLLLIRPRGMSLEELPSAMLNYLIAISLISKTMTHLILQKKYVKISISLKIFTWKTMTYTRNILVCLKKKNYHAYFYFDNGAVMQSLSKDTGPHFLGTKNESWCLFRNA